MNINKTGIHFNTKDEGICYLFIAVLIISVSSCNYGINQKNKFYLEKMKIEQGIENGESRSVEKKSK